MIESIQFSGRLGNRMIQLIHAGLLAKELDLFLSPQEINLGNPAYGVDMDSFKSHFYINPELHSGKRLDGPILSLSEGMNLNDVDLSNLQLGRYQNVNVCGAINPNLQADFYKKYYKDMGNILLVKNPPEKREGVFVHCRLEDVTPPRSAPFEYFDFCLSRPGMSKSGVISTADVHNPMIIELSKKYNLEVICLPPAETIALGSSFESLVLDAGSFSFMIGILSNAKKKFLYWPPQGHVWTGNFPLKLRDEYDILSISLDPYGRVCGAPILQG